MPVDSATQDSVAADLSEVEVSEVAEAASGVNQGFP
jgi:hypothetical protein